MDSISDWNWIHVFLLLLFIIIMYMLQLIGFPKGVSFAEVSLIGKKSGLDALKIKIKEKIDE